MELKLWYPSYGNNLGVVSKLLKLNINKSYASFGITVDNTYFIDRETFNLELHIEKEEYKDYIKNMLFIKYGKFNHRDKVSIGDKILGRLQSPNKVGFGIFSDIGLRSPKQDILIPLYQLREDLNRKNNSTREIVQKLGLIDGFPMPLIITEIHSDNGSKKINARISDEFLNIIQKWKTSKKEKLIVTKFLTSKVSNILLELNLTDYIHEIETIDPLTTIIHCNNNTRATGIIPIIGNHLKNAPIGIFNYNDEYE